MSLIQPFLQIFFNLLYHSFAFTYDVVAGVVSFGRWKDWVLGVIPYVEGIRVLELGHGPGHLQLALLRDRGLVSVAMDESASMGRLAGCRLGSPHRLTRALVQKMPYVSDAFDTIISTFPSEYIFDIDTLLEAHRVLRNRGRFIILLSVLPRNPLLGWVFKVTGQSPPGAYESVRSKILEMFAGVNFQTEVQLVEVKSGSLLIIFARKEESKC